MAEQGTSTLLFTFAAAGVQTWTADADYLLYGAQNTTTQSSMFSGDPFDTITSILGTPTKLVSSVLVIFNGAKIQLTGLKIPILTGKTYYARADGITALQLWLEPAFQLSL